MDPFQGTLIKGTLIKTPIDPFKEPPKSTLFWRTTLIETPTDPFKEPPKGPLKRTLF